MARSAVGQHQRESCVRKQFFKEKVPYLRINVPDGTYFGWLDCRSVGLTHNELENFAVNKLKLAVLGGSQFGKKRSWLPMVEPDHAAFTH